MSAAKLSQAARLLAEGRVEQARQLLTRALQTAPADADLCNAMMLVLVRLGEPERALHFAERACRARPRDAALLANLGNCHAALGASAEAERTLRGAIDLDPTRDEPRLALANLLCATERYWDAADELGPLARKRPHDGLVAAQLIGALPHVLRVDEAVAAGRAALARIPGDARVAGALAFAMNYDPSATPQDLRGAHRTFGALMAAPAPTPALVNPPDPERPLRVGILSQDLRRHPVASFLEPLLAHADRDRIRTICYATSARHDDTTDRLRGLAAEWVPAAGLDAASLRRRVVADRIDVLFETAGLTQGHRLDVAALRAAPVQITGIGYPNTTGMDAIDARLVDSRTDPADDGCVERPARMDPVFLCYAPPRGAPPPGAARTPGPPVFGSFNAAAKLNGRVAAVWAEILDRVPGSRLILRALGFSDPRVRAAAGAMFTRAGVDPARLELRPPAPEAGGHLAAYAEIDVALDPFPYNGTTTTCEAMWMGVPVVTLIGTVHAGRVGLSLLSAVGLADLCAPTPERYVTIAADLAQDHDRRSALRAALRAAMSGSALCDGPGYASRFETAIRREWRRWCGERA